MARKYRVFWSQAAEKDLEGVIGYIVLESVEKATTILSKIQGKAKSLIQNPQRGRTLPELSQITRLPFKELIISPWRLIYEVKHSSVHVLAFFDSRRDLEDVLFERLLRLS